MLKVDWTAVDCIQQLSMQTTRLRQASTAYTLNDGPSFTSFGHRLRFFVDDMDEATMMSFGKAATTLRLEDIVVVLFELHLVPHPTDSLMIPNHRSRSTEKCVPTRHEKLPA